MIDDAKKGRLPEFFEEEAMFGAMSALKLWIERHGAPEALYRDRKNAFASAREASDAELLEGMAKPLSHFGRACGRLGVETAPASSPQAKVRVNAPMAQASTGWLRL
ncbi:MAG: hypothetical protein LBL45_11320 [Treponema sp.]|jgi:hypothetical protein|nr:hypothetical protein [Treponema sp.]